MKKTLLAVGLSVLLIYSVPLLTNQALLVFWGDEFEQLLPHMHQFITWIQSGQYPWFNFSIGLGSDALVGFMIALGSPFTWMASLFPSTLLPYLMLFFDVIRFLVIAYFSYRWISYHVQKEEARWVAVFIITFSGYMMAWLHYAPFIDPFMGFMMSLATAELWLNKHKAWPFILSIVLTIILNPYYFYMFSWFLVMYLSFRLFQKKQLGLTFFKSAVHLAWPYLLAVGISAFILIPVALILAQAPRINAISINDFLPVFDLKTSYALVTAFFSPVINDFSLNLFYSYTSTPIKLAIPHIYPLVIGSFLWIPFVFVRYEGKKYLVIFISLLALLSLIPAFYIIVNGIMDVRWVFMIIFVNALMAAYTLEHRSSLKTKEWLISAVLWMSALVGFYVISRFRNTIIDEYRSILHLHIAVSGFLIITYVFLFIKKHPYFKTLFLILLIFEGAFVLSQRVFFKGAPNYITQEAKIDFKELLKKDQILDLQTKDQSFYRIDVEDVVSTQPAAQNFAGFSMYMSTYSFNIQSFYTNRLTPMRKMEYSDSKDLLKTILGSKYYLGSIKNLPIGYTALGNNLYQNDAKVGLGFASSSILSEEAWLSLPIFEQDLALYEGIVINDSMNAIMPTLLPILKKGINAGIDVTGMQADYFIVDFSQSNPNGKCQVDYSKDGEIIQSITKDDYGYAKFPSNTNAKYMYFYCSSIYNPNEYLEVNVYPINEAFVKQLNQTLSQYDHFENVLVNGSNISAEIKVSKNDSMVFTSIPYDLGWQVKVDGKAIDTYEVNGGFIGFKLNQGMYMIEMKFVPQGFILGISLSALSLLVLIVLMIRKKGAL